MPWINAILDPKSDINTKILAGLSKVFLGKTKVLLDIANELHFNGDTPATDFFSLPLINGEKELALAVILQNAMQPKNPQRREAITSKTYHLLSNLAEARVFLSQTLELNLKNELASRESQIRAQFTQMASDASGQAFLEAPDIHFGAAVLLQNGLLDGNGSRHAVIYQIMKAGSACKALVAKLKLVQRGLYCGHKMFHDKYKNHPEHLAIRKKLIFQMWLTLVKQKQAMTSAEFT